MTDREFLMRTMVATMQFDQQDVEIVEQKTVYKGYFSMDHYLVRYRQFDGSWSRVFSREVFVRKKCAGILLYDPDRRKVVLIEQFRMGSLEDQESPWLYEIVAGVLEDNESLEELIVREAKEEAGLDVQALQSICEYWTSPGGCSEYIYLFCGKIDSSNAGGVHGLVTEGEDIRVHVLDQEKAFKMVKEGSIRTSPAIVALQWLELNQNNMLFK